MPYEQAGSESVNRILVAALTRHHGGSRPLGMRTAGSEVRKVSRKDAKAQRAEKDGTTESTEGTEDARRHSSAISVLFADFFLPLRLGVFA